MEESGGQRLDSKDPLTMWSLSILPVPTAGIHPCSVHSMGAGDSQRLVKRRL